MPLPIAIYDRILVSLNEAMSASLKGDAMEEILVARFLLHAALVQGSKSQSV